MTFGRWLLIHSLSISIVVMLGVGYLFKSELKLVEAYNQLLLIDSSQLVISNGGKDKLLEDKATVEKPIATNKTVDIKKPSIASLSNKDTVKTDEVKLNNPAIDAPSDSPVVPTNNQRTLNNKSQADAETDDYLLMAREAYWDKNYQYAIELYLSEIIKNPNSADLYGELGNIYYSVNNYDTAAVNYLKAGEIFLLNRDEVRAKMIYDILASIAPIKAEALLQLRNQQYQ